MKKNFFLGLICVILISLSAPIIIQAQDYTFEKREEKEYTVIVKYKFNGKSHEMKYPIITAYSASEAEERAEKKFEKEYPSRKFLSANAKIIAK